MELPHREQGCRILSGHGLEVGALNQPAKVPARCSIQYLDIADADALRELFPELKDAAITKPDFIGDVGTAPVEEITGRRFDFIILNHTLEHVANPIQVIANVWGAVKEGGLLVLSVPDKRYTFDRNRPLTTYEHLLADYFRGETAANDDHYVDYLAHVHPEAFTDRDTFRYALDLTRRRREHVHVWDSKTFRQHLLKVMRLLDMRASLMFESPGRQNRFEYFAILRREAAPTSLVGRMARALQRWAWRRRAQPAD